MFRAFTLLIASLAIGGLSRPVKADLATYVFTGRVDPFEINVGRYTGEQGGEFKLTFQADIALPNNGSGVFAGTYSFSNDAGTVPVVVRTFFDSSGIGVFNVGATINTSLDTYGLQFAGPVETVSNNFATSFVQSGLYGSFFDSVTDSDGNTTGYFFPLHSITASVLDSSGHPLVGSSVPEPSSMLLGSLAIVATLRMRYNAKQRES